MAQVLGGTSIKWNNTELQTTSRHISETSPFGGLDLNLNRAAIVGANKSKTTGRFSQSRTIPLSGRIVGTNLTTLKAAVDDFLLLMQGRGYLDIDIDQTGVYRRYEGIAGPITMNPSDALFAQNFSLDIICDNPFGRDVSATTLINNVTISTASSNQSMTIGGTFEEQYVTATYTVVSRTGAGLNTVTLKNNATGQQLSVIRAWAPSDIMVVDFENKSVKVNGAEVDYFGSFIKWAPGAATLVVSDDFTARSTRLTVTQNRRYR